MTTVIEVEVMVPFSVEVIVSVSIGDTREGCTASDGAIESTAETRTSAPSATASILYVRN